MASNMAGEVVQVGTKIDRKRTMSSATAVMDTARRAASALVEREERRTRSRMAEYEAVAAMVGTSGAWVRKFVNGYAGAKPGFVTGYNILTLYGRLCGRIERAAEDERAMVVALKGQIDAAFQGDRELVEMAARSAPARKEDAE